MKNQNIKPSWTDHYTVKWNDCLATGIASLEAMCGFFQESAWHHADHLGVGFQKLRNSDQAWVLARLAMHIAKYPAWRETITVKTWPTGLEKIFARRDFLFLDADGTTIGSGASWWIIINPKTRQPQTPEAAREMNYEPRLESFTPERLRLTQSMAPVGRHIVEYLETDQLGHVNNTRYAAWLQNALGMEWNKKNVVTDYQVEFMAEAFTGDSIVLASCFTDGNAAEIVNGIRESYGREIFRAKVGCGAVED
ncbi:MAG TPA: thioesterase [Bacteroidales bacterium]|nr:thioesterase [Bacteroidales bacterium]